MDLAFSAEDVAFRDEVRTWLSEHTPKERRPRLGPEVREFDLAWQRTMYDAGWGGVAWPVEYGGRDLPLTQQLIKRSIHKGFGFDWKSLGEYQQAVGDVLWETEDHMEGVHSFLERREPNFRGR